MIVNKNIAISDSGFIFNPDTGESFTANPIGLDVLEMLKEGLDYEGIKEKILAKYDSEGDTLENDYNDFIAMLRQYNLIKKDGE